MRIYKHIHLGNVTNLKQWKDYQSDYNRDCYIRIFNGCEYKDRFSPLLSSLLKLTPLFFNLAITSHSIGLAAKILGEKK